MPDTANVSMFHQFNNQWDLMADVQYTGWSSIQQLQIVRSTGAILSTTPENFRDTWRFSVGANYRYSRQWTFRGGLAFDQTPVRDAERTPRLPDNDRTWLVGRRAVQVLASVRGRSRVGLHFRQGRQHQPECGKHGGQRL